MTMNETTETNTGARRSGTRYIVILLLVLGAFFASYQFAQAGNGQKSAAGGALLAAAPASNGSSSGAASGDAACACCGTGASAPASASEPKQAVVEGAVQKITVDVSKGYYDPSAIVLKAGVPAEITFSQSAGCTAVVESPALGFQEDLSTGPKTVTLPALQSGEYGFSCGMQMVFGTITVS